MQIDRASTRAVIHHASKEFQSFFRQSAVNNFKNSGAVCIESLAVEVFHHGSKLCCRRLFSESNFGLLQTLACCNSMSHSHDSTKLLHRQNAPKSWLRQHWFDFSKLRGGAARPQFQRHCEPGISCSRCTGGTAGSSEA